MFDSTELASPASDAPPEPPRLTGRQQQVLDVVCAWLGSRGYPPTVREIGEELGLTSSSTVHSHLAALERAGIIERDPSRARAYYLMGLIHEQRGEIGASARAYRRAAEILLGR